MNTKKIGIGILLSMLAVFIFSFAQSTWITPRGAIFKNIITNSCLGVWSLSTLAQATTGAQSDFEIGPAIYNETGEVADDSGNWAKTDCTMALTNNPGNGAGGSDNYYTITEAAATQRISQALSGLTIGKIYKFSVFIENGTGTWASATLDIMDNALVNVIETTALATEAAWEDYSIIFEATETNNQMVLNLTLGGGLTALLDNMRVIEVGPGCVSADDSGPDTWTKTSTLDIIRVQSDTTNTRGLYGVKATKGANGAEYLNGLGRMASKESHYMLFRNRTVTLGCWVYSVTATDNVLVEINDSDGTTQSNSGTHVVADTLTWVEVSRSCGASITSLTPRILFDGDTSDIAYVSEPMFILGSSLGSGNYEPIAQEVIWFESQVSGDNLDGLASNSDVAATDLEVEADADAKVPKEIATLYLFMSGNDSGSAAGNCFLLVRPDGAVSTTLVVSPYGLANDSVFRFAGWTPCDVNGDIDYQIEATGASTFDIGGFRYKGVKMR